MQGQQCDKGHKQDEDLRHVRPEPPEPGSQKIETMYRRNIASGFPASDSEACHRQRNCSRRMDVYVPTITESRNRYPSKMSASGDIRDVTQQGIFMVNTSERFPVGRFPRQPEKGHHMPIFHCCAYSCSAGLYAFCAEFGSGRFLLYFSMGRCWRFLPMGVEYTVL